MNEKNYDYLVKQLRGTGFGEDHAVELKEKILEGAKDFALYHQQDYGKDSTVATLHFRKSDETDMYFLNRYSLALNKANTEEIIKHTFYINPKQDSITLKEGYNLLSGRAIEKEISTKEGEKYNAWLQLDFKQTDKNENFVVRQFHPNYGFDLKENLEKLPIKELENPDHRQRLIESLQRGNRQSVTMVLDAGKEAKVFIEAAPQFKAINLYDANMKRTNIQDIRDSSSQMQSTTNAKKQSSKESLNEDGDGVGEGGSKKGKRRKNSQHL